MRYTITPESRTSKRLLHIPRRGLLSSSAHFCDDSAAMPIAPSDGSLAASLHRIRRLAPVAVAMLLLFGTAAHARDGLGVYGGWGAFRDPLVPRCYAIAMAEPSKLQRDYQPYASVGTWPRRALRNQVHFRLSRNMLGNPRISLAVGGETFELTGGGGDAWAADRSMNAAILAAMRSAQAMTVSATDATGARFSNSWALEGAASAMDAAAIGCARAR